MEMDLGCRYIVRDGTNDLFMVFLHRKWKSPRHRLHQVRRDPGCAHIAFTSPIGLISFICATWRRVSVLAVRLNTARAGISGPGYAQFVYLRDPDGHRIECFNDHYQTMDIEDEPIRFSVSDAYGPNIWGPDRPTTWRNEGTPIMGG